MPIPNVTLYPPFNVVRLSHVEFTVKDLAASRAFYVDTLGLLVTEESAQHICLRAVEERGHHCIVLRKGAQPATGALAFKVYDDPDLDKAKEFFEKSELKAEWVERPHQGRTLLTRDPQGIPLEFYARMDRLP